MQLRTDPIFLSVCICLALFLLLSFHGIGDHGREGFATKRAIDLHKRSVDVFTTKGLGYTAYKSHVEEADPVLHRDLKDHYLNKTLTPEAVERALLPY